MSNKHSGPCPYCGETITPELVEKNTIRRDVCLCPECKKQLLVCRTPGCHNYTKGGEIYDDELCPSCTASIASGLGEVLKWGAMAAAGAIATAVVAKKTDT
jgi:hypothetical protein